MKCSSAIPVSRDAFSLRLLAKELVIVIRGPVIRRKKNNHQQDYASDMYRQKSTRLFQGIRSESMLHTWDERIPGIGLLCYVI